MSVGHDIADQPLRPLLHLAFEAGNHPRREMPHQHLAVRGVFGRIEIDRDRHERAFRLGDLDLPVGEAGGVADHALDQVEARDHPMAAVERGKEDFGRLKLQGPIAEVHIFEQAWIVVDIEPVDLFGPDMRRNRDRFTLRHPSLVFLTSNTSVSPPALRFGVSLEITCPIARHFPRLFARVNIIRMIFGIEKNAERREWCGASGSA